MTTPSPQHTPEDELDKILNKQWRVYYDNAELTSLSDTYYIAQLEAKQAIQSYLDTKVREAEKAYGGCHNCYGKGYATNQGFVSGGGKKWQTSPIKYCTCDRGKQLRELTQEQTQ